MTKLILTENDYKKAIDIPVDGVWDSSISVKEEQMTNEILSKDKRIRDILIPKYCINKRVKALAHEIVADYKGAERLDVLVVMAGAMIFASDLAREVYAAGGIHLFFHLVKTNVYATGVKKSGEESRDVRLMLPPEDVKDKDIIIIDDIVDQGFTLTWLYQYLMNDRACKSIKICTLLNKQLDNPSPIVAAMRDQLKIDYSGFYIKDRWITGYGIDTNNEYRNMPFIVTVKEEYFI